MTLNYTNRVERSQTDGADPREIPAVVAREVIKDVEHTSVLLQKANVRKMSTREEKLNLLSEFPEAEWLGGTVDYPVLSGTNASGSQRAKDSQPKKTTKVSWSQKATVAEEIAVTVVVPDAFIDDAGAPIFEELKPLLATAFAKKIDAAGIFGEDTPFAEGGLVESAIATGNIVLAGAGVDLADDLAILGQAAAEEGVDITGFLTGAGFPWRLYRLRDANNNPIYAPPAGNQPATIYGLPTDTMKSGVWDNTLALALAGEWDKVYVGVRQDMTFSLSDSGVLYDPATGLVKYSAFQQDGKILRAVMRLAYVVVNPVRHLGNVFPFFVYQDNSLS
jgi:HK97 family phage major capsid protein